MMGPDETAKKFLFVNVLSETTVWWCYHLFYVMDCAYQLFLLEKINTWALLLLKTRRKSFFERWGIYFRICFLKRYRSDFYFEQSKHTLHCFSIIQKSAKCFPCSCLQQHPQRVGWGGAPWFFSPHTHSVRGYTNRSLFQTHSYQEMVNLERFECVCPYMQWKNVMKREYKCKTWSERSKNKLWPFHLF